MVAVGQQNAGDAQAGDFIKPLLARLDGVDAEVAFGVADEVAVEVVTVGLGKPRPREYFVQDLPHTAASLGGLNFSFHETSRRFRAITTKTSSYVLKRQRADWHHPGMGGNDADHPPTARSVRESPNFGTPASRASVPNLTLLARPEWVNYLIRFRLAEKDSV